MKAKSKVKRNIYIGVDGAAASSAGEKVREKSRGRRGEEGGPDLRLHELLLLYATMLSTLWMDVVKERKRTSSDWSMI